jgi:acetyl esterase/lipase
MNAQTRLLAIALVVAGSTLAAQQGAPNEGTAQPGPRLKIERNLEYARVGGQALTLDLYRQDRTSTPNPVVLWIHGTEPGAAANKAPTPAAAFVTPGYAVASIDYRAGNASTLPMQVADAKAAVRWLRANATAYNLDAAHIAVMGYGAGAEVAALLGTSGGVKALEGDEGTLDQSSRVQAVVDLAGPMNKGTVNPVAYVTKDSAPTLILHGTADTKVPTWDSQRLVSAL